MIKKIILMLLFMMPVIIRAQHETFRFAQITDVHLNATSALPTEYLLKTIAQINATDSIDFVLVTGDLTEEGDRITLLKVNECLKLLKAPVYVALGNHETKWSDSGCTAFSEIFGGERFSFVHKGVLFLGFNSGPLMRMAYGHVAPQDIEWMKAEMSKHGKEKPVILVTHYPMLDGDVDNWYDVTDAVRPYNVRLFIGGHYHSMRNLRYDGIPGVLMRSNLADNDDKPGYGIYDVTADSVVVYSQRIGEQRRRYAAFSLSAQYYDHGGHADHYPDFSMNTTYPGVTEQWRAETSTAIFSSPVVDDRRVFVGDDAGQLIAFDRGNGRRQWTFHCGARIVGTPGVANGMVVFGSADKYIYGLNAAKGTLSWKIQAGAPVLGAVAVDNGVAYIGASDSTMRAIDMASGKVIWQYKGVRGYIETKPLVLSDRIIFGAWDNTLYCLSKTDGREMWRWTGGLERMHFSPAAVWSVASEDRVFIVDPQRALTAIDIRNGNTIWRTFRSMVRESLGISADATMLFAKTMQDSVVCYSTMGDEPREIWATDVQFGYEHAPSMPLEKDGVVYGGTKDGMVYALKALDGTVLWKHKIGNSLINTVLPLSDTEVIVTSSEGHVAMLREKGKYLRRKKHIENKKI